MANSLTTGKIYCMQLIDVSLRDVFNYKYIFNPSLTRDEDNNYLLVCRVQNNPSEGFLGLCTLDRAFNVLGEPAIITLSQVMKDNARVMLEDPRTFTHDGKIYLYHVESSPAFLYFCYTVFGVTDRKGILENQVVLNYKKNLDIFKAVKELGVSKKEKVLPQKDWKVEKNWQFFIQENKYYCIYQAGAKHEIFRFDFPGGTIHEKYITYSKLSWKYGRISGGAAPILHTDGYYYCFFHSWSEWENPFIKCAWQQRKYHIGVYVFDKHPPFRIKMISGDPIFSGSDTDKLAESGHSVVFPGSALFDEKTMQWNIALGWNDHSCKVLRIGHDKVKEGLKPVSSLPLLPIMKMKMMPHLQKIRLFGGRLYRFVKQFR